MPGPFRFPIPADFAGLSEPLIPEAPVRKLQDAIDSPSLERSPWEARLRGFGAGALEGLRQQTSPANLAALAANAIPGVGGGLRGLRSAKALPAALSGLRGAAPAVSEVAPTAAMLGETAAEFAPVGGEAAYNAGRQVVKHVSDPVEAVYKAILAKGGR